MKTINSIIFLLIFAVYAHSADNLSKTGQNKDVPDTTTRHIADFTNIDTAIINDSIDLAHSTLKSTNDTVEYSADTIEYDVKTKVLLLIGNGYVKYQGMVLYADTIYYMVKDGTLLALGTPTMIENTDTVAGESMMYNIHTRRGRVKTASATSSDTRYNGNIIAKSDSSAYYIDEGDYTSCALIDTPHYTFYTKNIKVLPGEKAISRPMVLNIGGSPVAALPYYILPLKKGRHSGFLRPRWGGNVGSGGYLDNLGYYFAPNDYMDYTISGKITEFKDWVARIGGRYALRYWFDGAINGEYAHSEDLDKEHKRWAINYRHNQKLLPDNSMTLSGRGNLVSDKQFYKNYSEDTTQLLNQTVKANLNLNKRFKKINASGSITWDRSHNLKTDEVNEYLPSVSFSLPSRPFFPYKESDNMESSSKENEPKWFNKIYYSYNTKAVQKREYEMADTKNIWTGRGLTHSINISSPQKILKYLTVSPNFSFRQSLFDSWYDTTSYKIPITVTYVETLSTTDTVTTGIVINQDTLNNKIRYFVQYDSVDTFITHDTTHYYDDNYNLKDAMTYSWRAGASLSTTMYGVFPIKIFNFVGLRHTFTPALSYSLSPKIKHGSNKNFSEIGIPIEKSSQKTQSLNISISNLFQGKTLKQSKDSNTPATEKKFNILNASLNTGYNFEGEKHKWKDIGISATTSQNLFNVSFNATVSPYDSHDDLTKPWVKQYNFSLRPKAINAGGSFWDGDILVFNGLQPKENPLYKNAGMQDWSFNLTPSYSLTCTRNSNKEQFKIDKIPQLSTSARLKFSSKWSTSWSGKFDFRNNKFVSNTINLDADLECWFLHFEWRPSGYYSGFRFEVGIKKHRDIKWEIRDR